MEIKAQQLYRDTQQLYKNVPSDLHSSVDQPMERALLSGTPTSKSFPANSISTVSASSILTTLSAFSAHYANGRPGWYD
jgi:hypothetical protein